MSKPIHEQFPISRTDTLFKDMKNPAYQGPSFTWSGFPSLASRLVEAELFLYYTELPENFEQLKVIAGQNAFEYALSLVTQRQANLVSYKDSASE